MDKRVQNKLKRNELDKIMSKYPALNKFLKELTDDDNEKNIDLEEIVESSIKDIMKNQFMRGVITGFNSAMLTAYKKIEKCNTVEEAIEVLKKERKDTCDNMNLKSE